MARTPLDMVMTLNELFRYPQISRSTRYKLAQKGKLPGQRIRLWQLHRDAVDERFKRKPCG